MIKVKLKSMQRGSVTIEATVSLIMFIFFFFAIFSFLNICRAQSAIAVALDQTAKEMSQYAYFYKMSGLDKLDEEINIQAGQGKDNMNRIIGSFDHVFKILNDGQDVPGNQLDSIDRFAVAVNNSEALYTGINQLNQEFDRIMENPMEFMKSIAAFAGQQSLDFTKSQLVAAPLSRAMSMKYFGAGKEEASSYLESLGVSKGFDGLNFNMSTIFNSMATQDIKLTVFYEIRLAGFMGMELKAPFSKSAITRGWLAGDQDSVKKKNGVGAPESREEEEEEKGFSVWEMTPTERGKYIVSRERAYFEGGDKPAITTGMDGYNAGMNRFITVNSIDPLSSSYQSDSRLKSAMKGYATRLMDKTVSLKQVVVSDEDVLIGKQTYTVGDDRSYKVIVVIPEDADEARVKAIAEQLEAEFEASKVSYQIMKGYGASQTAKAPAEE